jgi:hypothetical protein
MITADEINKLLLRGEVEYIKRAFLKERALDGYYISLKGYAYNLFISDKTHILLHSGRKVLNSHAPYINRCYYVLDNNVTFEPKGLKV